MKQIALLAFSLSVLFVNSTSARLHETPDECAARYGHPEERDEEKRSLTFLKNGYLIHAIFNEDNQCSILMFMREDEGEMSENEIEILVTANLGEDQKKSSEGLTRIWRNPDGDQGQYEFGHETLTFVTKAAFDAQKAAKKTKERDALNGF